jgi:hypothetical protein
MPYRGATLTVALLLLMCLPRDSVSGISVGHSSTSPKKPFDVVWSGLWPCCDGQTGFNLSAFPVLQQHKLAWFGPSLGLYNETYAPNGLPQTVDLERHGTGTTPPSAAPPTPRTGTPDN